MSGYWDRFREELDKHYHWPSLYIFKFIVPRGKEKEVKSLFPLHLSTQRSSRNGNYVSVTIQMMMPSSDAIVDVYISASQIEGIIAL